jgi:hypothetical protein
LRGTEVGGRAVVETSELEGDTSWLGVQFSHELLWLTREVPESQGVMRVGG